MKHLILVTLLLSAFSGNSQQYVIDPAHTNVEFEIAHFKINKVKGTFSDVSGFLNYSDNPSGLSFDIKIKTSSIDTNSDGRDQHLKSADFFDAEKFPEITFKSKRVEKQEKGLVAFGELTLHGVTNEIQINFSIGKPFKDPLPRGEMRVIIAGNFMINRKDYGLNWSRSMETGELFVGDEVQIEINSEFYIPKVQK